MGKKKDKKKNKGMQQVVSVNMKEVADALNVGLINAMFRLICEMNEQSEKEHECRCGNSGGNSCNDINTSHYGNECAFLLGAESNTDKIELTEMVKDVVFDDRKTIVKWLDGTHTVVECEDEDEFSPFVGFQTALMKKAMQGCLRYNYTTEIKHVLKSAKYLKSANQFAPKK